MIFCFPLLIMPILWPSPSPTPGDRNLSSVNQVAQKIWRGYLCSHSPVTWPAWGHYHPLWPLFMGVRGEGGPPLNDTP